MMKFRPLIKKYRYLIGLFILFFVWRWCLSLTRHFEILDFFAHDPNSSWIQQFVDKKIDFCNASWINSELLLPEDQYSVYSPSRRFQVLSGENEYTIDIKNLVENRLIANLPFEFANVIVRWTPKEDYLIFLATVAMNDDWEIPYIYIVNLKSGKEMKFAVSETQTCS